MQIIDQGRELGKNEGEREIEERETEIERERKERETEIERR